MKSLIKVTLFIAACLLLLYSCSPYPREVEKALTLSGNNKQELIKVLEHYKDSNCLKFEAACFLIGNMPYHKSKVNYTLSDRYFNYFKITDSICNATPQAILNDSIKQVLSKRFYLIVPPAEKTNSIPDNQIITANFLIENIEQAFYEWKHSPLLKSISFDEFKEYILPYRVADEAIVDNKRILKSIIYPQLSSKGMNDIRTVIENFKKYTRLQKDLNKHINTRHHIGTFDLFMPAFKMDCKNLGIRTCHFFRACGIPVVYEFTPQWPDKDSKHYWCVSPDSNGILQPYTPPYNNLREDWPMDLKYVGKVYQRTFAAIKDTPYFLKNKDEIIPAPFNIPTIKDVTDRYHPCTELTLSINTPTNNNIAYLAFFNTSGEFTPVGWGKINKKKGVAIFKKVPTNILFFPCYIEDDGNITPFYNPVMLRQDSISKTIICYETRCDTSQIKSVHLLRKYPYKRHSDNHRKNFIGACLLGANNWDGPYDTLLIIQNIPEPYLQEYQFENHNKYRFYRLQGNECPLDIAELEFLSENTTINPSSLPTPLPTFSTNEKNKERKNKLKKICGTPKRTSPQYMNSFDGNPNTYARWRYFGMDFKYPVCMSSIRLLPRNSMNGIEPGKHYQLLYYNNRRWIEFKNINPEYHFLDIDSIPSNTIYWLRNLDEGKEELPFFYEDGKQIFINEYM